MIEKYAFMMKAVHMSIRPAAVVEEPYTSLDELTFDCLFFVLKQPQRREDSRVSRQPVLVLVLVLVMHAQLCPRA